MTVLFRLLHNLTALLTHGEALPKEAQLQQHQAVRNAGEHAAWLGIPEGALQQLHERCDPSQQQLNKITWVTAYSEARLNLVEELIS